MERVSASASDMQGNLSLWGLMGLLSRAAEEHVAVFGEETGFQPDPGTSFVLVRFGARILQPVGIGDSLRLATFQSSYGRTHAQRGYQAFLGEAPAIEGASDWMYMDAKEKRAIYIPEAYKALTEAGNEVPSLPKLRELDAYEEVLPLPLSYADYDINGHVNNQRYFAFCYFSELLDYTRMRPVSCTASFRSGILWGSRCSASSHLARDGGQAVLSQKIHGEGGVAALLESRWEQLGC
jgi:acyl-CoA thioesterase FadM